VKALIEQLAQQLLNRSFTLAVAESCTGGMLAQQCTSLSGSAAWFQCGYITYSNASKIRLLGVQANVLDEHGAVSSQVAIQMAEGALIKSACDVSASITGIAGPSGGSNEKPVGTVYIAIAVKNKPAQAERYSFSGDRQSIREQSTVAALEKLISETNNG